MNKHSLLTTVALAVTLSAAPSLSFAQGRGRGQDKKHEPKAEATTGKHADDKAKHGTPAPQTVVIDRDGHIRVIREYAAIGHLPPGLAKREQLPPGLRKQLREGGALPPGLQKRLIEVPQPLIVRLPGVPVEYHRYFVGDDLIVIDTRTNRIAAIVPNVWR